MPAKAVCLATSSLCPVSESAATPDDSKAPLSAAESEAALLLLLPVILGVEGSRSLSLVMPGNAVFLAAGGWLLMLVSANKVRGCIGANVNKGRVTEPKRSLQEPVCSSTRQELLLLGVAARLTVERGGAAAVRGVPGGLFSWLLPGDNSCTGVPKPSLSAKGCSICFIV